MNKPLALMLRGLGLRRPAPKTPLGRAVRRAERTLTVLALLYAGLQAFPQVLFAHSVTANGISIYSRSPLPPAAAECATRAAALVQQSELAVPGRHERVFVCNSPWLFRLFNPRSPGAFAVRISLTGRVFVADADFQSDTARRSSPDFNTRKLSSVMAHEITHGLIRHRLGLWRGTLLPDWVDEGYCEYVARESSFPEAEGLRRFAAAEVHPSSAYRYFEYRQMVRHLIDNQHLTFPQIVARSSDAAAVTAEARQAWQPGKPH